MAKYFGKIGYIDEVETVPGVWSPGLYEPDTFYIGETISNYLRTDSSDINDSVVLNTKFSIIADSYMLEHLDDIRYLTYKNIKWKVTNVEPGTPRVILTVGGVYNEQNET